MTQVYTRPTRGATDEWITPRYITDALGPFDLDPCASTRQPWPHASRSYTVEDDGLVQPWEGRVWLNSPYGPEVERWMAKLAEHNDGIALVFARTDTRWFKAQVWDRARALLFVYGRPKFFRPDGTEAKGNSGGAICLVAYGHRNAVKLKNGGLSGRFVWLLPWERYKTEDVL